MHNSLERVRTVIHGGLPDRPPLYDLLRNDAVLNHFTGKTLTLENREEVVYGAYEPAIDATRPLVRLPEAERTVVLEDGRQQRYFRWTIWNEEKRYTDSLAYAAAKRAELDAYDPAWSVEKQAGMDATLAKFADDRRRLGEVFYFPGIPGPGLQGIFGEIGLEAFSYYLADCPDIISELLERNTVRAIAWIEHLPAEHGIEAGMLGDDMAFKTGPLLRPAWMRKHYFPRLARVIAAHHARGIKVLFHSDGNLNSILSDLVDAGIDGLNPLEVLAGMEIADIHRRHPHLFLCGGIDVSQLLPLGTPQQVRETVRRSIEAAEGRLMVGSSTELNNEVPLANYLALREMVLDFRF
jgi:uroporphyrinogen decarboxylase